MLPRSARWILMLALSAPLVMASGCGAALRGNWKLVRAIPNRNVFALDHVSFNKDGTFAATVTHEGRTHDETGRYEYKALKLHLLPAGGGRRTYNVIIRPKELVIKQGDRRAILEKVD